MNVKKSLVVAGAVATVGVAGLTGLGVASATPSVPTDDKGTSSLVDKLVSKFNLNKSEVEAVFEADRAEHEAEMEQRMEERLDEAVADGKLTEDQKTKIIAKLKEIRADIEADRDSMQDKTPEERRELKQQKHDELQKWAEDNNIPEEYLMFAAHKGPGGGHMHVKVVDDVNKPAN